MDLLRWHKYNKECLHKNEYELIPFINGDKNAPVVLICPGGGYRMIAYWVEGEPVAKYFQSQGLNAFVLRYRFRKKAHCPAPLEDIARALTDIKEQFGMSIDNYALCGFSAGGHMCGLFGTKQYGYEKYGFNKPNCLFLIYPVTTLDKPDTHWSTRKYFAGEKDQESLDLGRLYTHIEEGYPKTYVWRGNKDRSVPYVNSDMLIDELLKHNIDCYYTKYYKVGHGVGLAQGTPAGEWAPKALAFWLGR